MIRTELERLKESLKALKGGFLAVLGFSFAINMLMLASPLYMLQVYDREGLPCHTCNSKIVKILQAGRGTFYCPCCQGEEENEVY